MVIINLKRIIDPLENSGHTVNKTIPALNIRFTKTNICVYTHVPQNTSKQIISEFSTCLARC